MDFSEIHYFSSNLVHDLLAKYKQEKTADTVKELQQQVEALKQQPLAYSSDLTHLHPTVQSAAGSLFATSHYSEAIHKACIALDKEVQALTQRPDLNGKPLMDAAFTPNAPLIRLSHDRNEQMGFMLLYQGVIQAIRNHYAHNLTTIPAVRALEWLGFISALLYKLDEAQPTAAWPAP